MDPLAVVPSPRQDMIVTDAATGKPRRMTIYTGAAWTNREHERATRDLTPGSPVQMYLPDSLPYRCASDPIVSAIAVPMGHWDSKFAGPVMVHSVTPRFVPDGSRPDCAWLALSITASGKLYAIHYQVIVTGPPESVLSQ